MVKKKTAVAVLGFVISVIVVPMLIIEYFNRPILDYTLRTYPRYNFNSSPTESVDLMICNRGGIDANVWLILTVENATIVETEQDSYIRYNGTQARILLSSLKGAEEMHYGYSFQIKPQGNPQTIVLKYTIEREFNWLAVFHDMNGRPPTTLIYNRTATNEYIRID